MEANISRPYTNLPSSKVVLLQILCLIILCFQQAWGQNQNYQFQNITVDQGLSQNTVECIYQDSKGYLWFGTEDGLDKYDGYSFKIFKNDPSDQNTISNNTINCICPYDSAGNILLIGTNSGLNKFYTGNGNVERLIPRQSRNVNLHLVDIYTIYKDRENNIWIGTGEGIRLFETSKDSLILPLQKLPCLNLVEHSIINSILEDFSGNLWIGSENGLLRINKDRKNYRFYKNEMTYQQGFARTIFEDSKRNLWFCKQGIGIKILKFGSDDFLPLKKLIENNQIIDDRIVPAIIQGSDGSIWLGSRISGLYKLTYTEKNTFNVSNFRKVEGLKGSLSSDIILSLFKDHSGIIWAGTSGGGINKFVGNNLTYKLYRSSGTSVNSIIDNSVWSFFEEINTKKDILWIGTNKGLSKLNRDSGKITNYPEHNMKLNNRPFPIRGICKSDKNNLWLATIGGGLMKFDKVNSDYQSLINERFEKLFLKNYLAYCILRDQDDVVWVGTNSNGLMQYNLKTNIYSRAKLSPIDNDGLSNSWVMTICAGDSNYLWFGTWKKGLIKYNKKTGTYHRYLPEGQNVNSINSDIILSLYRSKNDILWIGTYGGGLNKLNLKTNKFSVYTESDGLSNNVIYGILEDDFGNLWMSTNKGISKFNPEKETFISYDVNDGLQGNEFNLGAAFKTGDGELFFGGDNGFNAFYPDESVNKIPPQIVFTSFTKNGTKTIYKETLNRIKDINLSYDENSFSIEFVALHYKEPLKNQYAFMLNGYDKRWIYPGKKRFASYSDLTPGSYNFEVKASNSDGVWTKEPAKLAIIISPPYWHKLWFLLASAALLLIGAFIYYRNKAYRILKLEKIKDEERENLRKKIAADFHDELGHRVTKISMMTKLLEKELETEDKLSNDYIDKIIENADGLFNEMREFIWELNPEKDSLCDLATQLKSFSEQLFDKTDIAFQLKGLKDEFENVKLPMDWRQHLLRIFKEAMHNILKHAKDCNNVCLEIFFSENKLTIVLADDGKGFFDEKNTVGNGIKNMHNRAEKINGKLRTDCNSGSGLKIIFDGKLP